MHVANNPHDYRYLEQVGHHVLALLHPPSYPPATHRVTLVRLLES